MSLRLPVEAIRAALAASDWEAAHALLGEHEAELRALLDGGDAAVERNREALLELLGAQRAMIEELRTARDEAGRSLEQLGDGRRGIAAYARGGA